MEAVSCRIRAMSARILQGTHRNPFKVETHGSPRTLLKALVLLYIVAIMGRRKIEAEHAYREIKP